MAPVLHLAFSMVTLQPLLQALWITCTLWISKAAPRKFVARCIQSLIFLSLTSICFLALIDRAPSRELRWKMSNLIPPTLHENILSIMILLPGYIILSAWVSLDLQLGSHSFTGHIWRLSRRLLAGLALIVIPTVLRVWTLSWDIRTLSIAASILGFQIFWLVLEFSFERLALPGVRKRAIRGGLFCSISELPPLANIR